MIDIKRSDIQKVVSDYHNNDRVKRSASRSKQKKTYIPYMITNLNKFLTNLNRSSANDESLTPEQTYELIKMLLTRKPSALRSAETEVSEALLKTLEKKFSEKELEKFKEHLHSKTFDYNQFMIITKSRPEVAQEDATSSSNPTSRASSPTLIQQALEKSPSPAVTAKDTTSSPNSISRTSSPQLMEQPLEEPSNPAVTVKDTTSSSNSISRTSSPQLMEQPLEKPSSPAVTEIQAMIKLLLTSEYRVTFFSQPTELINPEKKRAFFSKVALGKLNEVAILLQNENPKLRARLLTCRGSVFHPNCIYDDNHQVVSDIPFEINPGRYQYDGLTLLQIYWANGEFQEAQWIERLIHPVEVAKQFFELFPEGEILNSHYNPKETLALLLELLNAITQDETINAADLNQMNETTKTALMALYHYAKPNIHHKTGMVSDPRIYQEALEFYHKYSPQKFQENWAKYKFWLIRVEEWLAGCLGTAYLRHHAQGMAKKALRKAAPVPWMSEEEQPPFYVHEECVDHKDKPRTENREGCVTAEARKPSYFAFYRPADSIPGLHCFINYLGKEVSRLEPGDIDYYKHQLVRDAFYKLCVIIRSAGCELSDRALQTGRDVMAHEAAQQKVRANRK